MSPSLIIMLLKLLPKLTEHGVKDPPVIGLVSEVRNINLEVQGDRGCPSATDNQHPIVREMSLIIGINI